MPCTFTSLVAQLVKTLPAVPETRVRSLGREDPPGEGNGNPLQYSRLENAMDRGAWQATVHGVARVGHNLATKPPPRQPPVPSKAVPWTGPFPDSSSILGAWLSSAAWPPMLSVPLFCRPSAAGDLRALELELIPLTCKAFRVEGRFFENHSEAAALN